MISQSPDEFADDFSKPELARAGDYGDVLRAGARLMSQNVKSNFDNAATAGGMAWPQRKDNKPHPLLRLSLALESAATGSGANHVERIADNTLEFGVGGIIYAGRQNDGDEPGSRDILGRPMNIPAREYMAISEDTAGEIQDLAADALLRRYAG